MKRERNSHIQQRDVSIPTESDWGNYREDLDQEWAHRYYCGRSNEEMQAYFRNSAIEAASDLQFMPEVPFRYYMLGYRDFVLSGEFEDFPSTVASCFLNLVAEKLEKQPQHIIPIMPDLLDTLEYVAQHQVEFDAEENIYGSFLEKLKRIKSLYAENRDRY